VIGINAGNSLQLCYIAPIAWAVHPTETGRYPLNEEMVPMPNTPDEPPSSTARSAHESSTEASAGHLVCAYSPRWLSGPTPAFEGLVATWSPTDEADGAHPSGTH